VGDLATNRYDGWLLAERALRCNTYLSALHLLARFHWHGEAATDLQYL
jgi:hypothetical protein